MLDYIRSNAQSLGVKIAFGVIILVFVFWGVGSMNDKNSSNVVATVNGKALTAVAFEKAYRQAEESIRRANPGVTSEQMKQFQLPRQILQQLVVESLLLQEAERLSVVVSPVELRRAVEQMPMFQDAQGTFDVEAYKRIMSAQRQSMGAFEEGMRRQLLEEKMRRDITAGGVVTPDEARAYFNFLQEQRDVEYVFFAAKRYPQADPAEDELKAYYESHREAFAILAKTDVEYILVRPADLAGPGTVSAEAVKSYYEKNAAQYAVPARARVSHILLRLAPDAPAADVQKATALLEDVAAKVAKGGDFAALARKHSQDDGSAERGGALDWIKPEETVPAFNEAVFAMKAGEVSKPVRTDFGLHLIKVEAKEEARTQALAEVEKDIRAALAELEGGEKMREVLDNLIEANILGKPLVEAAKAQGLSAVNTGLKSVGELEKLLQIEPKDAQSLLNTPAGSPLDTALEAKGNAYLVARIKEKTPADTRPFAEVKPEIIKTLTQRLAREAALKAAAEARKGLDKDVPATLKGLSKVMSGVQRGDTLGVLGLQPEMAAAVFTAPVGQWLPVAYAAEVSGEPGAVLARPVKVLAPDDTLWEPLSQIVISSLENQRKGQMFQAFMSVLMSKAKVEIVNSGYLQRLESM